MTMATVNGHRADETTERQLRRRSVGAPAARSALLTVLGEFVQPLDSEVWQETLVHALGTLGYRTHAARQALARSVSAGWLQTRHEGRRSRMCLTPETDVMLREGTEHIYNFGAPWTWDGRWLLLALRIPEERRDVRHQARTTLIWRGFGSLGGGLWLTPHVECENDVIAALDLGEAELTSFRAEIGALGDAERVVGDAWDLDTLAGSYRKFITRFSRLRPTRPDAVFRAQAELVHEWRKFAYLDPGLPSELLPARWPRPRALELFRDRHARWNETARTYFSDLEAGTVAPPASV
jgi:phenylacetic acid degradation operon negative regulatory protein